jgi:hypothetical protein
MHKALEILGLESLKVVHTGKKSYPLGERIEAISIRELL